MKWHFVGGKGGVGKTTCAAALALSAARSSRTLLLSTDPASSLADTLAARVGPVPRAVRGVPRLSAARIDAQTAFSRWLSSRKDTLGAIALRGTYLDGDDVQRLLRLSLPGVDEVMALLEIRRLSAGFDRVYVDTAPTGHTLRLLGAPAVLEEIGAVLDVLQAHHREVVGALRGAYEPDAADALIAELNEDGRSLRDLLRDGSRAEFSWIALPEPMALEETADALATLGGAGIRVHRLVVNRVTPPPPEACDWCAARRRFEARAIAAIARRFPGLPVSTVPACDHGPVGVAALGRVAAAMSRWRPPRTTVRPPRCRMVAGGIEGEPVAPRQLAARAQWLLVGGKGGAGKSTCAAAIALDAARADASARVLLVSSDPAHSIGDVLGEPFGDRPRAAAAGPPNLLVREIDAAAALAEFRDRYIRSVDTVFDGIARRTFGAGDAEAFRRIIDLAPPGIDEVIAIADLADAIAGAGPAWDLIVSDTAPTGHAIRLLQTPGILREWVQALMAILVKYREIAAAGALGELLVALSKRLRGLDAWLTDAARTRFVVVTRAESVPRAEALRLVAALRAMRIHTDTIVVNAVGTGTCSRCRSARATQDRELGQLRRGQGTRGDYAIIETPAEVPPPHGVAALDAWGRLWRRVH